VDDVHNELLTLEETVSLELAGADGDAVGLHDINEQK
jgi:hypothetical protein